MYGGLDQRLGAHRSSDDSLSADDVKNLEESYEKIASSLRSRGSSSYKLAEEHGDEDLIDESERNMSKQKLIKNFINIKNNIDRSERSIALNKVKEKNLDKKIKELSKEIWEIVKDYELLDEPQEPDGESIRLTDAKDAAIAEQNKIKDLISEFQNDNILNYKKLGAISYRINPSRMRGTYTRFVKDFTEVLRPGSHEVSELSQSLLMLDAGSTGDGVCLPLVLAMAMSMANNGVPQDRRSNFISNLNRTSLRVPMKFNMFSVLSKFHSEVKGRGLHQVEKPPKNKFLQFFSRQDSEGGGQEKYLFDVDSIINEVKNCKTTTFYSMQTNGHSMLVGVTIKNRKKIFHFFDPNIGIFDYLSAGNMCKVMKEMMSNKTIVKYYKPFNTTESESPKFELRKINSAELNLVKINGEELHEDKTPIGLYNLSDPTSQLLSTRSNSDLAEPVHD